MQRHRVDEPLDELLRLEVTRRIQHQAAPAKARRVFDLRAPECAHPPCELPQRHCAIEKAARAVRGNDDSLGGHNAANTLFLDLGALAGLEHERDRPARRRPRRPPQRARRRACASSGRRSTSRPARRASPRCSARASRRVELERAAIHHDLCGRGMTEIWRGACVCGAACLEHAASSRHRAPSDNERTCRVIGLRERPGVRAALRAVPAFEPLQDRGRRRRHIDDRVGLRDQNFNCTES